jgi:hypothetical protein
MQWRIIPSAARHVSTEATRHAEMQKRKSRPKSVGGLEQGGVDDFRG